MENVEQYHEFALSVLEKESQGYEELLGLAREQREHLLAGRIAALSAVVDRQSEVMGRVASLGRQAHACLQQLKSALSLDSDPITLATLADVAPQPYAARYGEVRARMRELTDQLHSTNAGNHELVRNALAYIDFSLRLIGAV